MSPAKPPAVTSNICAICIKPMNPHEDSHASRCGAIASSSFSSATMSLHFLHHSHKRLCRFAYLRRRLCRSTSYTTHTSDFVALLIFVSDSVASPSTPLTQATLSLCSPNYLLARVQRLARSVSSDFIACLICIVVRRSC